uniref:Uncharacterized protein n=1 Tax=Oryza rufipogon TaxID=4529 RepID=A0A0E0NCM5_ORYRU
MAPSVLLRRSVESGHCADGVNSASTFGVQVAFGGFRCGCYGDSEVKALLGLPVLATATPSGVVHILEGVAIGVLIQLHIKGIQLRQLKTKASHPRH